MPYIESSIDLSRAGIGAGIGIDFKKTAEEIRDEELMQIHRLIVGAFGQQTQEDER